MNDASMLAQLQVLDLTQGLGAEAGRVLASLGAEVTKIEPPGGDPARAPVDERVGDASASWYAANLGKQGLCLDLRSEDGWRRFAERLARADVLIRGSIDEPASHASLREIQPRLIDVVITGFDARGARRDRPHADLTLMARSGLMTVTGDPDRAPLKLPGEQSHFLAGVQGAIAALTALAARAHSGRGELITVSALQSAVCANYREPTSWQWARRIGRRTGNRLVRGASGVRQVWHCRDGLVTWSLVDNPGMMRGITRAMRAQGVEPSFASVDWERTLVADTPQSQIDAWEREVEAFFLAHSRADLARAAVELGFGLSPVDRVEDALGSAHLREREFWSVLEDAERGLRLRVPGRLFRASDASFASPTPPPSRPETPAAVGPAAPGQDGPGRSR